MSTLAAGLLLVLVLDQACKLLVLGGLAPFSLGPLGKLQVARSRIWLEFPGFRLPLGMIWALWFAAAGSLLVLTGWIPSSAWFVGFLLGGSLSHALETSLRGCIIDYVRLRFWPAFNLADVAILVGTLGLLVQLAAATLEACP